MNTTTTITLTEAQKGPAEKLLDLTLNASAHLWHNRPGVDVGGTWHARRGAKKELLARGAKVVPGLHVPAAVRELLAHPDRVARPQGRVRGAHARPAPRGSADQG